MEYVTFGIINSKERFVKKLKGGDISNGAIVLIQDTHELWVHGTYIKAKDIEIYNGLDSNVPGKALDSTQGNVLRQLILVLADIIQTDIARGDAERRTHVPLTQEEYTSRKNAGLLSEDTFYYIIEPDDEDDNVEPESVE